MVVPPPNSFATIPAGEAVMKLPHPYQTEYEIQKASAPEGIETLVYRLAPKANGNSALPFELHNARLVFSDPVDLKSSELPRDTNNSPWARARRSPCVSCYWDGAEAPTLAQFWLLTYVVLTVRPVESFRLALHGANAAVLAAQLRDVLLAIEQPLKPRETQKPPANPDEALVLVLQSTFWQGAGSPFGPRPVWCPAESPASLPASTPLGSFPIAPLYSTQTIASAGDPEDPERYQQSWHPIRPAKPAPGTIIYSRWVPHLQETFSMVVIDHENEEHLRLFHEWQNDPRVSQDWSLAGSEEQHKEHLQKVHKDPHQLAILGKWDDTFFAYFEVYWAKEDPLGGFLDAGDFNRGRHSLVGDVRFRGPPRVSAWWSSLMHYLFLDDPRTMQVVGDPQETNTIFTMYHLIHGFGIDKFVDLPQKRSAYLRCSRERFFQLCPLGDNERTVGGLKLGLVPKL